MLLCTNRLCLCFYLSKSFLLFSFLACYFVTLISNTSIDDAVVLIRGYFCTGAVGWGNFIVSKVQCCQLIKSSG